MNLSNITFHQDPAAALELDTTCRRELLERLHSRNHPAVLAASVNLVASRLATGDKAGAETLRDETRRLADDLLGGDHPYLQVLRDGGRIGLDIEPAMA
jgi:hypothetical protein